MFFFLKCAGFAGTLRDNLRNSFTIICELEKDRQQTRNDLMHFHLLPAPEKKLKPKQG